MAGGLPQGQVGEPQDLTVLEVYLQEKEGTEIEVRLLIDFETM